LCLDIFVCNLQPSLKAAQLRIRATHVPQENYEHISTILLGGDCIGASCLDTATGSTPKTSNSQDAARPPWKLLNSTGTIFADPWVPGAITLWRLRVAEVVASTDGK
jgi:hypothetical protein